MAAGNFDRALPLVLKHEGGYVDHPQDPGGATNLGVTIGTLSDWLGRPATKAEVRALTRASVAPIYRKNYWDRVRADELPPGVDYCVFDFAVNSGPKRAAMALQRAIGVADDGVIGSVTLASVAGRPADQIIRRVCADRLAFLRRLKTWPTFGKGWGARVEGVEREALTMLVAAPVPTPPVKASPLPPPPFPPAVFLPRPAPRPSPADEAVKAPPPPVPPLASPTSPAQVSWVTRLVAQLMRPWFG